MYTWSVFFLFLLKCEYWGERDRQVEKGVGGVEKQTIGNKISKTGACGQASRRERERKREKEKEREKGG